MAAGGRCGGRVVVALAACVAACAALPVPTAALPGRAVHARRPPTAAATPAAAATAGVRAGRA